MTRSKKKNTGTTATPAGSSTMAPAAASAPSTSNRSGEPAASRKAQKQGKPSQTQNRAEGSGSNLAARYHVNRATIVAVMADGSVIVEGREAIGGITTGASGAVAGATLFRASLCFDKSDGAAPTYPTLSDLSQGGTRVRVGVLAQLWEKFSVEHCGLEFVHAASQLTSGQIVIAAAADPGTSSNLDAADQYGLTSRDGAILTNIATDANGHVPVDRSFHYNVLNNDSSQTQSAYSRFCSFGLVRVAAATALGASQPIGTLFLKYRMRLMVPTLVNSLFNASANVLDQRLTSNANGVTVLPLSPLLAGWTAVPGTSTPSWYDPATNNVLQTGVYRFEVSLFGSSNYPICVWRGAGGVGTPPSFAAATQSTCLPTGATNLAGTGFSDVKSSNSKCLSLIFSMVLNAGENIGLYALYDSSTAGTTNFTGGTFFNVTQVSISGGGALSTGRGLSVGAGPDYVSEWIHRFPQYRDCGPWMYSAMVGAYVDFDPPLTPDELTAAITADIVSGNPTAQDLQPSVDALIRWDELRYALGDVGAGQEMLDHIQACVDYEFRRGLGHRGAVSVAILADQMMEFATLGCVTASLRKALDYGLTASAERARGAVQQEWRQPQYDKPPPQQMRGGGTSSGARVGVQRTLTVQSAGADPGTSSEGNADGQTSPRHPLVAVVEGHMTGRAGSPVSPRVSEREQLRSQPSR